MNQLLRKIVSDISQDSISAAMGPSGSFSSNIAGPGGLMSSSSGWERLLTWLQPRFVGMMGGAGVSISSDFLPLGSSTRSRMLELNVEYRDRWHGKIFFCSWLLPLRMIRLKVQDHESIQTVKTLLQAEVGAARKYCLRLILSLQVGVPPCQQELRGWKGAAPFPLTGATFKKISQPMFC